MDSDIENDEMEIEAKKAIVQCCEEGNRLDQVVARLFADYSRSCLSQWIRAGFVSVDGERRLPKYRLKGGEEIVLVPQFDEKVKFLPESIPLNILFEDESLIVIDKPANFVVHPAAGNWSGTLLNALLYHSPQLALVPRAGIVHRLDKDTTGLMVVAKTLQAQNQLVSQLQRREVKREYEAVVTGELVSGGTVDKPIGRHLRNRKMMTVREGGKESKTHYKIITRYSGFSHLCISLDSGRTHQIRVHMSHINYAILGDQTYSPRSKFPKGISYNLKQVINDFKRQALHARKLELIHPLSGDKMSWTCELPEDMRDLLECLSVEG